MRQGTGLWSSGQVRMTIVRLVTPPCYFGTELSPDFESRVSDLVACCEAAESSSRCVVQATVTVTITPISVYHGQKISVPTIRIQTSLVEASVGRSWIAVITVNETNIPIITGVARPFFQNTASPRPPNSAPLVKPRNEKAAFKTNSTRRLKYA